MDLHRPGETVGDVAFRLIRQDILSGALEPGSKLRLEQLKDRYGVSVPTLREILSRLSAEDLVIAEGQRGFNVSPATRRELIELGELRALMECHAVSLSFTAGDLEWEAGVVAAHHKLMAVEGRLINGDMQRTADWVRYDWEFHRALVSACKSQTLMNSLSSVFDRFLRYHLLARSFRGKAVSDDHRKLFEFALARDIAGATAMLKQHVDHGIAHVLATGRFS